MLCLSKTYSLFKCRCKLGNATIENVTSWHQLQKQEATHAYLFYNMLPYRDCGTPCLFTFLSRVYSTCAYTNSG